MGGFELETFLVLAIAGFIAAFGVVPYMMSFVEVKLTEVEMKPFYVGLISATQGGVLAVVGTAVGLVVMKWAGLGVPIVERLLAGRGLPSDFHEIAAFSVVFGLGSAAVAVLLERFVFWNFLPEGFRTGFNIGAIRRAPATLYGGISEELIVRLMFMSLFAWGLKHAGLAAGALPSDTAMWVAITLAALVFGLLHLPAAYLLGPITRVVAIRTLALNGVVGLAVGWLFWEYGLIAAFIAHWVADVVVLLIAPQLIHSALRGDEKPAQS